jgi:uncharacterized protein (TIGR02246 family)
MLYRLFALFIFCFCSLSALEERDLKEIQDVIKGYTESWNQKAGKGFGDNFTDNADFVNIFGMIFSGKEEVELRHVQILNGFLKGSTMEILNSQVREVQPGVVVAHVRWKVAGFRTPQMAADAPSQIREGVFSHLFVKEDKKWKITATQNTLAPL